MLPVTLWAAEPAREAGRIPSLINQLGSDRYAERVAASQALDQIGEPALPLLRQALKGADLEIRRRADELIPRIEMRMDTARAFTPLPVRFTCKDLPVPEAVTEFTKQTGHPIQLTGDVNRLAARRITLDTGDTTFWDAFAQLCAKAGVHEPETNLEAQPNMNPYSGRVVFMGRRGNVVRYGGGRMPVDSTLVLQDGAAQPDSAIRNGSLRIRSLPPKSAVSTDLPDGGKELTVHLEVRPEARIDLLELIGVHVTRHGRYRPQGSPRQRLFGKQP